MFEKSLKGKLERIFGFKKVTFDHPSESQEQECIFIEVTSSRSSIKDGREISKTTGKLKVFASSEKMPFGFFAKRIKSALESDTKDLFFYDMDENSGYFGSLVERSMSFVYFFDSQYDPNLGTITSITLETTE
jgi:hypothetical protein